MMTLTRQADFSATHRSPRLPSFHECHLQHGHQWSVRLEVVAKDNLTDDQSVAVHTAFAEFDTWVADRLERRSLNDVDAILKERCSADDLARWIFLEWDEWIPHLDAVHVAGPLKERWSNGARQGYERYEVSYRAADDPLYGKVLYPLDNDDVQVAEAQLSWGEEERGPEHERTAETVKILNVRFADGHTPYTRWMPGNDLTIRHAPDAPLLRVESLTCLYRYDHQFRQWWAPTITAATVHAQETGDVQEPREERSLGAYGESSEETPTWVKSLVATYRPAPDDAPPLPRTTARS
ncbi:6-pyruvoyl tetrahydropterin synthase family protein [Streptomyces sp. NPDC059373]